MSVEDQILRAIDPALLRKGPEETFDIHADLGYGDDMARAERLVVLLLRCRSEAR
ncbi:MAG TPA: hypothetical protein VFP34_03855 [Microlunatus sp.]|nr:hypothetical protein [Microlunatus sp.]